MLFHSLTKVFSDEPPVGVALTKATLLKNERFSFQSVFYRAEAGVVTVSVDAALPIKAYRVGEVQVNCLCMPDSTLGPDVLRTTPGKYPDVLYPLEGDVFPAQKGYNSLWLTVEGDLPAGDYPVTVTVDGKAERCVLTVIDAMLPPQTLTYTCWFHTDCIAAYYKIPTFGEQHWTLLEKFFRNATAFGQTMLYVPLYTPPLDTAVGGERPTVQLLDITLKDGTYTFDFSQVERFIRLALACGFTKLEMPHLFTQWGAKATPKIFAHTDEGDKRIFGWDVESVSAEYRSFLAQMLPALRAFLQKNGWEEISYFHFSDEPNDTNIDAYIAAREGAAYLLEGCRTTDALSHYEFYEQKLIDRPFVSTGAAQPFIDNKVDPLWVYYCCGPTGTYSNRFTAMPSRRTRALGFQLFANDVDGFLQWGHNFWYSQGSTCVVDPFTAVPEIEGAAVFPSGDTFIVYPGTDGPWPSLRQMVFADGLQDMRACQLLAQLTSKQEVLDLLATTGSRFTFDSYPMSDSLMLGLRDAINRRIGEVLAQKA
ncbi:MAG: DUF4091 domain-containing protein [Ruminococcaceae bacterium]|nr:DUF4091 domain-containing protein [Oscillospiraceae bacterium]